MKARPIPFSAPMVRALLEGRKTQTRRIIAGLDHLQNADHVIHAEGDQWRFLGRGVSPFGPSGPPVSWVTGVRCPFGQPGDLLWVSEEWRLSLAGGFIVYRADPGREAATEAFLRHDPSLHWQPSSDMDREDSRLTLEITGVRVERLQLISEAAAIAEGVLSSDFCGGCGENRWRNCLNCRHPWQDTPQIAYAKLWDSLSGKGSWDANPWVWVLEFNVHRSNIDAFLAGRAA